MLLTAFRLHKVRSSNVVVAPPAIGVGSVASTNTSSDPPFLRPFGDSLGDRAGDLKLCERGQTDEPPIVAMPLPVVEAHPYGDVVRA